MHIHIIGGFLGSGKTTAIIGAAKYLAENGKSVGVITNEQGRHLVDTAFVQSKGLPAMEVAGGCFCCNFDDLNERLSQLVATFKPDVIFAESVGSCADVVATVIKPLLEINLENIRPSSFSVFTDIRLLKRFLLGLEMPFSEEVNYIFEKQIEEAGLLIINKADLSEEDERTTVLHLAGEKYPKLQMIAQNSLNLNDIRNWVDLIQTEKFPIPIRSLDIDYDRYAEGESKMVWVEREYDFTVDTQVNQIILSKIFALWEEKLESMQLTSGHVKVIVKVGDISTKFSLAQSGEVNTVDISEVFIGKEEFGEGRVQILLNAFVEGDIDTLSHEMDTVISNVMKQYHRKLNIKQPMDQRPKRPMPTHRILT